MRTTIRKRSGEGSASVPGDSAGMRRMRSLGRRGDTISPIIMWIGVILAVMIVGGWFLSTVRPAQRDLESAQRDVDAIRIAVEKACTSVSYTKPYNPVTEKGTLSVNMTSVCVNTTTSTECASLSCAPSENASIDLGNITFVMISMNQGNVTVRPEGAP